MSEPKGKKSLYRVGAAGEESTRPAEEGYSNEVKGEAWRPKASPKTGAVERNQRVKKLVEWDTHRGTV